jgi:hypothetical protein
MNLPELPKNGFVGGFFDVVVLKWIPFYEKSHALLFNF